MSKYNNETYQWAVTFSLEYLQEHPFATYDEIIEALKSDGSTPDGALNWLLGALYSQFFMMNLDEEGFARYCLSDKGWNKLAGLE